MSFIPTVAFRKQMTRVRIWRTEAGTWQIELVHPETHEVVVKPSVSMPSLSPGEYDVLILSGEPGDAALEGLVAAGWLEPPYVRYPLGPRSLYQCRLTETALRAAAASGLSASG